MKISEMFPRKYMNGEDIEGHAYRAVIEFVQQEELQRAGAKPEQKWVLYLVGSRKGIILSRTLAEQIGEIVGSEETADWAGKAIVIYGERMTVAGKARVGIRARAPKAGADTAELKHEEGEEE